MIYPAGNTGIIETWYKEITQYVGNIPTIIFGNKSDLISEDDCDETIIQDLIRKYNFLGFYKTSAKTGDCVEFAFDAIIKVLVNKISEQAIEILRFFKN